MGTLTVDYLQNSVGTVTIPVADLRTRIIQSYLDVYDLGEWNPTTTYESIPGTFTLFTPVSASSRIRYRMRLPMAWISAAHAIGHSRFTAGGNIWWEWSTSGTYYENAKTYSFDVPSWGTFPSRIGMSHRSYTDNSNELRMYSTNYWNGTGSRQNCFGQLMIEEWTM
jgi:hypothetical protein